MCRWPTGSVVPSAEKVGGGLRPDGFVASAAGFGEFLRGFFEAARRRKQLSRCSFPESRFPVARVEIGRLQAPTATHGLRFGWCWVATSRGVAGFAFPGGTQGQVLRELSERYAQSAGLTSRMFAGFPSGESVAAQAGLVPGPSVADSGPSGSGFSVRNGARARSREEAQGSIGPSTRGNAGGRQRTLSEVTPLRVPPPTQGSATCR